MDVRNTPIKELKRILIDEKHDLSLRFAVQAEIKQRRHKLITAISRNIWPIVTVLATILVGVIGLLTPEVRGWFGFNIHHTSTQDNSANVHSSISTGDQPTRNTPQIPTVTSSNRRSNSNFNDMSNNPKKPHLDEQATPHAKSYTEGTVDGTTTSEKLLATDETSFKDTTIVFLQGIWAEELAVSDGKPFYVEFLNGGKLGTHVGRDGRLGVAVNAEWYSSGDALKIIYSLNGNVDSIWDCTVNGRVMNCMIISKDGHSIGTIVLKKIDIE